MRRVHELEHTCGLGFILIVINSTWKSERCLTLESREGFFSSHMFPDTRSSVNYELSLSLVYTLCCLPTERPTLHYLRPQCVCGRTCGQSCMATLSRKENKQFCFFLCRLQPMEKKFFIDFLFLTYCVFLKQEIL